MKTISTFHPKPWFPGLLVIFSMVIAWSDAFAQQATTTIKNRTTVAVELFRVETKGVSSFGKIAPGETKQQGMNPGHHWQIRQGKTIILEYTATTARVQRIDVTPALLAAAKNGGRPQPGGAPQPGGPPQPNNRPVPAPPVPAPPGPAMTGSAGTVSVTVVNTSVATLNLYRDIPGTASPEQLGDIPANSEYSVTCRPGTEWILAFDGTAVANYTTSQQAQQTFTLPDDVAAIFQASLMPQAPADTTPGFVNVTFSNGNPQTVDVFLVENPDPQVEPTLFATIGANDSLDVEMAPATQWVFGIAGNQIGQYIATTESSQRYSIGDSGMAPDPAVVNITMNNTTGQDVGLYYVTAEKEADGTNKLEAMGTIPAGASVVQPSYVGSSWVFGIGDSPIGDYTTTAEPNQVADIAIAATGGAAAPATGGTTMARGASGFPIEVPGAGQAAAAGLSEVRRVPSNDPDWDRWVQARQMEFPLPNPTLSLIVSTFRGESMAADRYSSSGYDVLYMDPRDLGTKPGIVDRNVPIFEPTNFEDTLVYRGFGNYQVPDFYAMKVYDQTESKSISMLNFSEAQSMSAWRASAEVGYQGAFGGGSVSGSYSESEGSSTASQTMSLRDYKYFSKYWLTLYKQKARLSQGFKEAALRLPGQDQAAFDQFFHVYGTHYPLSTLYGGVGSRTKTFTRMETGTSSSETFDVAAEGNIGGFSAKAGYGEDQSESRKMGFESSEEAFISRPASASFETFGTSPANDFIPIKVVLEEIHELIRPQLFDATDAGQIQKINALRTEMKARLSGYLGSSDGDPSDMGPRKLHAVVTIRSPRATTFSDNFRNNATGHLDRTALANWIKWTSRSTALNSLESMIAEARSGTRALPKTLVEGKTDYQLPPITAVGLPTWKRDPQTRAFRKVWIDVETGRPFSNEGILLGSIQIGGRAVYANVPEIITLPVIGSQLTGKLIRRLAKTEGGQEIGVNEINTNGYGSLQRVPRFKWQDAFNQSGRKPKRWDGPFESAPSKAGSDGGDVPIGLLPGALDVPVTTTPNGEKPPVTPGDDQILVHRYYDTWPTNPPVEVIVSFYEGTVFDATPSSPLQFPEPPEWLKK